jgi:ABC-type cobalamin/Fe3+-siderophores transport system ATPase subunit
MRIYDRNDEPAPACLSDSRSQPARDALMKVFSDRSGRVEQTRIEFGSLAIQDEELQSALKRLFRNRCAWCEREVETRPYRFRPTEEAGPSSSAPGPDSDRSHLYYTWLTNAWQNLYSICSECLPYETSIFPVRGMRCPLPTEEEIAGYVHQPTGSWRGSIKEKPLFLDPCAREDLRRELAALPDGNLVGLSDRGSATIKHFNLARPDLVEQRRSVFGDLLPRLVASGDTDAEDLFDFDAIRHGGAWFLLLYQVARRLGGGGGARPVLSRLRIGRYFYERMRRDGFRRRVEQVLDDLLRNPHALSEGATRKAEYSEAGTSRPVRFRIRNFKALEDLEVVLPDRTIAAPTEKESRAPALVIIGENAAGKSSILEAMALVLASEPARRDLGPDTARFMLDTSLMGSGDRRRQREASVEAVYEDGEEASIRVHDGGIAPERAPRSRIPVYAYGAFRLFLDAGRKPRPSSAIRSLFEANYVLPNPEKWLVSIADKPLFNEVVRALRYVLALDQKFDVVEVDRATQTCNLVITTERPGAPPIVSRTPLRAVSSGFRSVLGMICDVLRRLAQSQGVAGTSLARAYAVVLIDEVEAHLHPRWKMRIMRGLREALPNVTFIVTTHDPLCLRSLAGGEIMVLRRLQRPSGGRDELPEFVEQLQELPAIGALTLEQLLTSDLFQLFTTDAPETEVGLAGVGDLLAREHAREALTIEDESRLARIRQQIGSQVAKSLPIGSTAVERLVQEAVEEYLRKRHHARTSDMIALKDATRERIVSALQGL